MRFFCSTAAAGFILHELLLSVSCLPECHFKSDACAKYKEHQIVTKVWRETVRTPNYPSSLHRSLHESHILLSRPSLSPCLRACLSLYPCQTNVALWPHSSTVSEEQLVSIRSPFRSVCAHAHIHTLTHTKKEWGGLLSLAHCSVEGVIESFDQNIGGAVRRPVLAVVTALCLSIRLGWSSSRSG